MQIGIDAQVATTGLRAGLFQHLRHLTRGLAELAPGRLTLLVRGSPRELAADRGFAAARAEFGRVPFRVWSPPPRFYRLWVRYGPLSRADVFWHNLGSRLPEDGRAANVFVVPDLIPLSVDYGPKVRAGHEEYCRWAVARGDVLLVWSEHTRQDVLARLSADPGRVRVVPLAAGPEFHPAAAEAVAAVRRRHGLGDDPYILCTSTIEVRKNHVTLIRAFARLVEQDPSLPHLLAFAGGKWVGAADVFEEVNRLGLTSRFRYLGYAEDLPALYTGAAAFVFPSLYEGFGLPPLEAMACGTPVLVANATSLPEVVGDAGLLFEPLDDVQLCDQLRRVIDDPAVREQMVAAGRERAARFTWRKAAEGYLAAFREAYAAKWGVAR